MLIIASKKSYKGFSKISPLNNFSKTKIDNLAKDIRNVEKSLESKIQNVEKGLDHKVQNVERHLLAEIKSMDLKILNIEGQITQITRPNIIPLTQNPPEGDSKES